MKEKKKIPWSTIYLVATVVAIGAIVLANNQIGNVLATISTLSWTEMAIAVVVLIAFLFMEGFIVWYLLRVLKEENATVMSTVKVGIIGLYYSYITPSATGGQPAQVLYLSRDKGISAGSSVAALFIKFFSYQVVLVLMTVISFIFMYDSISQNTPEIIPFIYLGLGINCIWIVLVPLVFSKKILNKGCNFVVKLINKIKFIKKKEKYIAHVEKFREDFTNYTQRFIDNKLSVLVSVLLTIPQVIFQMGVLYFVFASMGNMGVSFTEMTAMQTILQCSVSFVPLPGASGAQEFGFSAMIGRFFTEEQLYGAMMIWRFLTYYLVVVSGAVLVIVDQLIYKAKMRKKIQEETNS